MSITVSRYKHICPGGRWSAEALYLRARSDPGWKWFLVKEMEIENQADPISHCPYCGEELAAHMQEPGVCELVYMDPDGRIVS